MKIKNGFKDKSKLRAILTVLGHAACLINSGDSPISKGLKSGGEFNLDVRGETVRPKSNMANFQEAKQFLQKYQNQCVKQAQKQYPTIDFLRLRLLKIKFNTEADVVLTLTCLSNATV